MIEFVAGGIAVRAESYREARTASTVVASGPIVVFHPGIRPEVRMMALEHVLQHWDSTIGQVKRGGPLTNTEGHEVLYGWQLPWPGVGSIACIRIAFDDDDTISDTEETRHG